MVATAFFTCSSALAQELKKKKNTEDNYQELYTVDKKTKERHGSYLRIHKISKDTLIKGSYENGFKTGPWSYYDKKNRLYLEYDFDQQQFVHRENNFNKGDSLQVQFGNGFKLTKVDAPAIYLGYKNEIERSLNVSFEPPSNFLNKGNSGMVMASFEINLKGEMENLIIETSFDKSLEKPIKNSLEKFKTGWVPAEVKGQKVSSKMYVIYNLTFTTNPSEEKVSIGKPKADLILVNFYFMGITRNTGRRSLGTVQAPYNPNMRQYNAVQRN